jgi:hypothetical protein
MAEAVGLALAVLPLFISAANYYREGLDSLQMLRPKIGDDQPTDPIASASDGVLTFESYRLMRAFSVLNLACSERM